MKRLLFTLALLACAIAVAWGILRSTKPATPHLAVAPATSTAPATTRVAATAPAPPADFIGLVRDTYPDFPATEPLAIPAELRESARLTLREPMYLDSSGELWITRADAPPIAKVFKSADDDQVHFTRERVRFVHHQLDDAGNWQPQIVSTDAQGNYVLISSDQRMNLGKRYAYQWDRAYDWNSTSNEGFVVPTAGGISIFRPRSLPVELHYQFTEAATTGPTTGPAAGPAAVPATGPAASTQPLAQTQALLDNRGLLAWIPWDENHRGSRGAARFVDGAWQPLGPDQGWPEKIVHLIPLIGGGVQQLVQNDDGTVTELLAMLDTPTVDEKAVDPLIDQLSDPDPKVRDAAYDQLTRYGPGLWPILEKAIDQQPPEGHMRIERLLAAKQTPTLGHMNLLPGKVRVLSHLEDGGALLLAEAGIEVPASDPAQPPVDTVPAYISIRPGEPVKLAPPPLVTDLPPEARFDVWGDEWVETDDAHGPQRLLGNHLEPLLHKSERDFSQFVGIDRRGRWLFRKLDELTPTLILDPTLPDIAPHLGAWVQPVQCDVVGWNAAGWPVVSKGENTWALRADEWSPLGAGEKWFKSMDEMPAHEQSRAPTTASSTATTLATSSPATTQTAPIFVDSDGTQYFDGQNSLEVRHRDGSMIEWPLPDSAIGNGEVHLLRADGKALFLFNEPGRVLRIVPTTRPAAPFKLEATFTKRIPSTDHYTRIWVDPAGRIDLEWETNHLTILFPNGRIPRAVTEYMPAEQLKDDE